MNIKPLAGYPNPVDSNIYLKNIELYSESVIQILNLNGMIIHEFKGVPGNYLDVRDLEKGSFILKVQLKDILYITKFIKL